MYDIQRTIDAEDAARVGVAEVVLIQYEDSERNNDIIGPFATREAAEQFVTEAHASDAYDSIEDIYALLLIPPVLGPGMPS